MCTLEAKTGRILENRSVDNEVSNQCLRLDVLFKLGLILFGQMTVKIFQDKWSLNTALICSVPFLHNPNKYCLHSPPSLFLIPFSTYHLLYLKQIFNR